jgi:predicted dehydrogenase
VPRKIRIGVVGCGEVAQIIHLPSLRALPELFAVTALCEVSPRVLAAVGGEWPEAARLADYRELVVRGDVDAVLVANPHVYHSAVALAAMDAGKHVFIEKPLCVSLAEVDALLAAEARSGVTVQVGYMRRYAPAFGEAVARVAPIRGDIILARVHDVIGQNALIIESTANVVRDRQAARKIQGAAARAMAAAIREAIGVDGGPVAAAYSLLLGLSSHDISAMRELIGPPRGVLHAAQRRDGRAITAAFDYGHFVCQFETTVDRIPHFDAHLEVYTPGEIIRVDYDTPYIRNLPARLTVLSADGDAGTASRESFPTRADSFVVEWRAFHENVTKRRLPKTSIADAREDLVVFAEMARLMAGG